MSTWFLAPSGSLDHFIRPRQIRSGSPSPAAVTPPIYMVFDVPQVGNQDLRSKPLRTRRKAQCGRTHARTGNDSEP